MFRSAVNANNSEIVGIVEADDDLYTRYTEAVKIKRYGSLEEMIDQASPDLILEGLSHEEKTDAIEKCARAGIHVLLDKPLCRTHEEWHRIKTAVETHNIKLSTFFTSRNHSVFIALREAILNGELGELVSLISTHPHKIGNNPPALYLDSNRYVGTFHDLAGHGVDQIRWLTGAEYTGVHALGTLKKHIGSGLTFEHVQASYRLSNGALATVTADWLTPNDAKSFGDTRFIIMGTQGSAHLRAYANDHVLIVSNKSGTYEPAAPPSRGDFVQNMVTALSRNEEHFISTTDTLAVAKACIFAEQSAHQNGAFLTLS
jgi:predicted dehydrogenase